LIIDASIRYSRENTERISPINTPAQNSRIIPAGSKTARVIAITSGKGGVGKTTVSVNLAIALATRGNKVCLFDADTGLANVNILLGLQPEYTLQHLLSGEKNIRDILKAGPRGLQIVPAASGIAEFSDLSDKQRRILTANLKALEKHFDYLIIDTAAGIDYTVQEFVRAAHCSIAVVSQEPTSLTDAFALLRVIKSKGDFGPVYAMINRVSSYEESADIYKRFATAVRKFLKMTPKYIGYVADDPEIRKSIIDQQPIVISKPHSPGSRCIYTLANGIEKHFKESPVSNSFADYWEKQQQTAPVKPEATSKTRMAAKAATSNQSAQSVDWGDMMDLLNRQIKTTALSQHQVAHAVSSVIDSFVERYDAYPFEPEKIILNALEKEDYPKPVLRKLVQSLESAYEKRYRQTMRNSTDEMLHFLANSTDAEDQYIQLAQLLNRGYHRRFNKNLFDEIGGVQRSRPRLYPVKKRR
jgi:flagellar biosynthesis protein FlhG